MKILQKSINSFYLFLFCFIMNFSLYFPEYIFFDIKVSITEYELEMLYINYDELCNQWVPSLSIPILLVYQNINTLGLEYYNRIETKIPILSNAEVNLIYMYFKIFLNKYDIRFGKILFNKMIQQCFFGLSLNGNFTSIDENEIFLYQLKNKSYINEKIFSFDKWTLKNNSIFTTLFLGDIHEHFSHPSKEGIIGTCNIYNEEPFWGCSFKEMIFNNNVISLEKENGKYYKIFFVSETYNIIFPKIFMNKFNQATNNYCQIDENDKYLYCKNLLKDKNYIPVTFTNENMNITTEIDSIIRFSNNKDEDKKYKTRIKFDDIDFFFIPLIMFKNFHVQFDGENKKISFYTIDESILKLKKEINNDEEPNNEGISTVLLVLIMIISILVILIIGFVIYIYIRNKKKESNIKNDIKKIEDIGEFHSME